MENKLDILHLCIIIISEHNWTNVNSSYDKRIQKEKHLKHFDSNYQHIYNEKTLTHENFKCNQFYHYI